MHLIRVQHGRFCWRINQPPEQISKCVLIIAVLQTMQWLRERFRDFEIPAEIDMPEAPDYERVSLENLKSFHIYDGYKVEAVWLPKEKNWTLQLTEPDLGTIPGEIVPERLPVPGRLIESNVVYRVHCLNSWKHFGISNRESGTTEGKEL